MTVNVYTKRTILAWKIFLSTGSERISHTSPARFKPMLFQSISRGDERRTEYHIL